MITVRQAEEEEVILMERGKAPGGLKSERERSLRDPMMRLERRKRSGALDPHDTSAPLYKTWDKFYYTAKVPSGQG